MRYKKFRIRNFKGIKDTTISLDSVAGANVFAFVGLNESGKTTVLEAIHSFSPDSETGELVAGSKDFRVPYDQRVPRHLISSFTGDVSVEATLSLDEKDISCIASNILKEEKIVIDPVSFGSEVILERHQRYKGGDFAGSFFSLRTVPQMRTKGQRKWREPDSTERNKIKDAIYALTPDICYFPTFVFDFPAKVFLTDRGSNLDAFYRDVFQDILDFDGTKFSITKDIIRRVRSESMVIPWLNFLQLWKSNSDAGKIQHVMDRASATVTSVVFGRWDKIFGENTRGKEIIINFDVSEGEVIGANKAVQKTHQHDVYIEFQVKDGTRRFGVNDRSLGFRWFFAFMLFTQFRVARAETRPILFLFDEPASNLHAAAQLKLIDCFPQIAQGEHGLIYTTHSHYMIEPKWLEQTFIVTNRAENPPDSILDAVSLDDESLDVQVDTYRSFVNTHPNQTSYFQPILDRLAVVPSRFDLARKAVVVEGRSDYYILRYSARMLGIEEPALIPALGAGTFGSLASLSSGWNLELLFLLDGDKQGVTERRRYIDDYGIPNGRIFTLKDVDPAITTIEDIVDDEAKNLISLELKLAGEPSKQNIKRFFQERLASENVSSMGSGFENASRTLLEAIERKVTGS